MRKPNRFLWLTVSIVLVLATLLGACGGGGGDGADVPPPGKTPKAADTPRPSDTPLPTNTPEPTATPLPTATPAPDPAFPMHTTHFSYGINADLYYRKDFGKTAEDVMPVVDDLGSEWVRIQVSWSDLEGAQGTYTWDNLDPVIEAIGKHNRKVLASIVRSPAWATADGGFGMPTDPNYLGDFLQAMATRYKDRIQAYEIWNEQNYAVENDGYVQGAGRYVELLKVAYARIKGADPYAMVLFGSLTPTGVNDPNIAIDDISYLKEAYEYNGGEVINFFDVLGAHVAGSANPPDTLWPDNPSNAEGWTTHPTHYFRHVENIRDVMVAYGDEQKQIWLTEFGWASIEGISTAAAAGYEYAAQNSALAQGDYLAWALDIGRTQYQPWMGAMFVWNLNYSTFNVAEDEKSAFSLVRPDWGTRPSYRAVQAYIAEHPTWP